MLNTRNILLTSLLSCLQDHGRNILHIAAAIGQQEVCALLVNLGLPVDARDVRDTRVASTTPCCVGVDGTNAPQSLTVRSLPCVRAQNAGATPLLMACAGGHSAVAQTLLEHGALADIPMVR